jgi:hypothetical protein
LLTELGIRHASWLSETDIEALLAAGAIAGRGHVLPQGNPHFGTKTPAATPVSHRNTASAKKPLDQLAVAPGCFERRRTASRFVPGKTRDPVAASPTLVHENVRLDNPCGRNVTMAN